MSKEILFKPNQFTRCDGFNPVDNYDEPFQEKWVHKQVVKKTGDGEDDFIIEEKPVLVDKINLRKSIQEEAKTTDLKYLLTQLLRTGDESIINTRPGVYGDFSMFDGDPSLNKEMPDIAAAAAALPEELADLSVDDIMKMSDAEIAAYIQKVREVKTKELETPTPQPEEKPIEEGGKE